MIRTAITLSCILFCLALLTGQATPADADQRPNVLWIITDDHRADALSCYNEATNGKSESELGYVSSPVADDMARNGTLFTNAYCNSPACAPSRASMITGQYPHHNGVYGFEMAHNQTPTKKDLVPEVMRKQGYATAMFGKAGIRILTWNGSKPTWTWPGYYDLWVDFKKDLYEKGFSDFHKGKNPQTYQGRTFEEYFTAEGKGDRFYYDDTDSTTLALRNRIEAEYDILRAYTRGNKSLIIGGQSSRPAGETIDGYIVREFARYLTHRGQDYETLSGRPIKGAAPDKPLFVSLNFHLPHTPVLPPKSFREKFADKVYDIPDFDKSTELASLPPQLLKLYQQLKIDGLKPEEKQQAVRDYYAFCAYGDALIGDAITKFKAHSAKSGREHLIVYTVGDHGWHLGEQGIEAKFAPYETSGHGAVIIQSSGGEFPKDTVITDFVEYVDFAPTILDAASVDVKSATYAYLDGYNLEEVAGGNATPREYVIGQLNSIYGPRAYLRSRDFAFSMRVRQHNGNPNAKHPPNDNVRWAKKATLAEVEVALFDLRKDPDERKNVALQKEYLALADWFRHKLADIVLGDGRLEVNWSSTDDFNISNFAAGADDKRLDIPGDMIPR